MEEYIPQHTNLNNLLHMSVVHEYLLHLDKLQHKKHYLYLNSFQLDILRHIFLKNYQQKVTDSKDIVPHMILLKGLHKMGKGKL